MSARHLDGSGTPPALSAQQKFMLACLLVLAAVAAHQRALHAALLYDDREVLQADARLGEARAIDWWGLASRSYWPGADRDLLWRPATLLSLAVQKRLLDHPAAYHAGNLVLHAAVVVVLFLFILELGGSAAVALTTALLFAVHPLASEAITLVVGRADLLTALASLGALLLVCRAVKIRPAGGPPHTTLVLLAGLSALACLSKESGFVLTGLGLLLLTLFPSGRAEQLQRISLLTVAGRTGRSLLLALLLPAVAVLLLRFEVLGHLMRNALPPLVNNPLAHAGFRAGRLEAFRLLGHGLWLFVWPHDLSVDYSFAAIPVPTLDLAICVQVAAGLGLAVLLIWLLRHRPLSLWGALFFLLSQSLTANLLVPIGTVFAERLLYLPMTGLCLLVADLGAAGVHRLEGSRFSRPLILGMGTVLLLAALASLTLRTAQREQDYADDLTLWRSTARTMPLSAKARYNLGRSLAARGEDKAAIRQYEASLKILPTHLQALNNLAASLLRRGRPREALERLEVALETAPGSAQVAFNRALAFYLLGRVSAAAEEFRRGAGLDPALADGLLSRDPRWRLMEEAGASAPQARPRLHAPEGAGSTPPPGSAP